MIYNLSQEIAKALEESHHRAFDRAFEEAFNTDHELIGALVDLLDPGNEQEHDELDWFSKGLCIYEKLLYEAKECKGTSFNIRKLARKAYGIEL